MVSIIVLTHNRWAGLRRCLSALRRSTPSDLYELLVYDNASSDATASGLARLARDWPQLKVHRNEDNLPFAIAVNRGMQSARGRHMLWLNDDAIPSPGWMEGLLRAADSARDIAAAGPMTNYMAPPEQKIRKRDQPARDGIEEVPFLGGFCFLLKREAFERVGLLDERFVWGWEDMDYCLRLRQAGSRLVIARDVFVHHAGSQTLKRVAPEDRTKQDVRNRDLVVSKWLDGGLQRAELQQLMERLPAPWHRVRPKLSLVSVLARNSVVIPGLLRRLRREGFSFELLCVDTSESGAVVSAARPLSASHPELRLLGPWPSANLASATNRAFAHAGGEYMAVIDERTPLPKRWFDLSGKPRANYGGDPAALPLIVRRDTFERTGMFDERFAGRLSIADYRTRIAHIGERPSAPNGKRDIDLLREKWHSGSPSVFLTQARSQSAPEVSIVVCGRSKAQLQSLRRATAGLSYELLALSLPERRSELACLADWENLRVIQISKPLSWAGFVNLGFAESSGKNVVWLDNGAMPAPGWIRAMVRVARSAANIGIVGPRSRGTGLSWQERPERARTWAPYLREFCLLFPRKAAHRIGALDERFSGPLAAVDYCLRSLQAGFEVDVAANAFVRAPRDVSRKDPKDLLLLFEKWSGNRIFEEHFRR